MGEQSNSLAGLIPGFGQGYAKAKEQKRRDAFLSAQTDAIKSEAKFKEKALLVESMKADVLANMSPEKRETALYPKTRTPATDLQEILSMFGAGKQEVPLPDYDPGSGTPPFRPGATMSIPQQVAQGQMGTLPGGLTKDDVIRGVFKKETGAEPMKYTRTAKVVMPDGNPGTAPVREDGLIDMTKAVPEAVRADMRRGVGPGMSQTETPTNPFTQEPIGAPVQTGLPPTMQVGTPTPGGGRVTSVVPIFPGTAGSKVTGTTAGGIRTELDLLDIPIPSTDITKWSDGKGNTPPMGWTPRQAQGRGFKQTQEGMPAETGGKVVMLSQAVTDMEKAIEMILPKAGGFNRKLALGAGTNAPEFAVEGSQIVRSAILNAMSAKLRMETGAQSNESEIQGIVDRYWPSGVRDNEKSARYKTGRLLSFMRDGKFIMDPKGRIVVVDPPAEKKKPGLSLDKKKDPSTMTNDELLKALQ